MSVNSKMTAIADPIRALMGSTGKLGLDEMASGLESINDEKEIQADLISQIKAALEGKAAGGGASGATVKTASARLNSNGTSISFLVDGEPGCFSVAPLGNITFSSSNRFVVNVAYDGTTTHGMYAAGSGSWNATYTGTYSATYFTWTYSNGTLTVRTSSATNGGYFASGVEYQLTYAI